jgi:hypothetical protein
MRKLHKQTDGPVSSVVPTTPTSQLKHLLQLTTSLSQYTRWEIRSEAAATQWEMHFNSSSLKYHHIRYEDVY